MKRKIIILLPLFCCFLQVAWAQYPGPFLTDETRPDGSKWLPDPPEYTGGDFANDFYYYQWGKTQRDGERGVQALWDESAELYEVFSEAMGITMTYANTPEIILLAEAATSDAYVANKATKNIYKRRRPFATFNEPSLNPEADEKESLEFSFPSTHSTNGWMFALALATIAPERTEALMCRAREYAMSRVICGRHWKSDVDASLMLVAGLFANVVVSEPYQAQLVKAKAEYAAVTGQSTGISAPVKQASPSSSAIYDIQGRSVSDTSAPGVYIQNGHKFMTK